MMNGFGHFGRDFKTSQNFMISGQNPLHMRYLGCGWEKAYHPWSRNQHTYTATELLEHLMMVVIPLSCTHKYPDDAPFELPGIPTLPTLGTQTNDGEIFYKEMEEENLNQC